MRLVYSIMIPERMELRVIDPKEELYDPVFTTPECLELISVYKDYYPVIGFHMPWVGYYIIRNGCVVGSCGFTGQPQHGSVEIAYQTFPSYRNEGVASFACRALIDIAQQTSPTITITAKTEPFHNSSTHILQKNGFILSGSVTDDEIGDVWLWVLQ